MGSAVKDFRKFACIYGVAAGIWSAQTVGLHAQTTHDITILFSPESGKISIEAIISGAEDLQMVPEDWIKVKTLQVGDSVQNRPTQPIQLTAADIAGRAVEVRLTGQLPETPETQSRFGVFPEGAFLMGGAGWLPLPHDDQGVFNITVQTVASARGVATGTLVEEHSDRNSYEASFRFEGAGDELAVFFGPYAVGEMVSGDLRFRTYFPVQQEGESDAYLEAIAEYIAHFENLIGAYPFEGFAIVAAPIPVGYGLRGLTYVSGRILHQPYMRGQSLAHEILHSWWGNGVRVDYADGNWSEGLTTYQADYAMTKAEGLEAAWRMREDWLRRLSVLPFERDVPARKFRTRKQSADQSIGYDKLAMMFHMLRQTVGSDVFDNGVRTFWDVNKGRTASWSDLQAAFEEVSNKDLSEFFAQWLDRRGLPDISLVDVETTSDHGQYTVTVSLAQSEPAYKLNVPILIETEQGAAEFHMRLDEVNVTEEFTVADRPTAVQIDPDYHVARRLPLGELPASFYEALLTAALTVVTSDDPADAAAMSALASRLAPAARDANFTELDDNAGAALLVGTTAEILNHRNTRIESEAPSIATQGTARAWVERDSEGRVLMFVSANDAADLSSLQTLRYYSALSFAAFEDGRPVITGSWPVTRNPLRLELP